MATKLTTGQVAVTALRPVQKKGQPWTVSAGRVAAESPEAAEAFAAVLMDSMRTHRDLEDARPRELAAPTRCANHDGKHPACAAPVHTGKCAASGAMKWGPATFAPASRPVCHRAAPYGERGWRVQDAEHGDYTIVLSIADDVTTEPRKPGAIARKVEPAKKSPARRARMAAPRRIRPFVPEPAPTPAKVERQSRPAPCSKCGKAFKTPAGAKWHAENNADCARWAQKGQAA